jgi:excisionase family DNA binding protein
MRDFDRPEMPLVTPDEPRHAASLTSAEAARFLRISRHQLIRYTRTGLAFHRMGKGFRFTLEDLVEFRKKFRFTSAAAIAPGSFDQRQKKGHPHASPPRQGTPSIFRIQPDAGPGRAVPLRRMLPGSSAH